MRSSKQITTAGILFFLVFLFLLITGIADVIKRGCGFLFIPSFTPTFTQTASPTMTETATETPTNTPNPTFTETPTLTASPTNTVSPTLTASPTMTASPTNTLVPTSAAAEEINAAPSWTDAYVLAIDETAIAEKIYAEAAKTMEAFFLNLTPAVTPAVEDESMNSDSYMINPRDQKTLYLVDSDDQKFWMGWNEVSNKEYHACEDAGICTAPASPDCGTVRDYYNSSEYADYPVVNVSFRQAERYCTWAGMALMSMKEWQTAVNLPELMVEEANLDGKQNGPEVSDEKSQLYGNVWEWTRDKTADGEMVIIGGSWKTSSKDQERPGLVSILYTAEDLGFRCVKPAE